jgi:hypothetical protein
MGGPIIDSHAARPLGQAVGLGQLRHPTLARQMVGAARGDNGLFARARLPEKDQPHLLGQGAQRPAFRFGKGKLPGHRTGGDVGAVGMGAAGIGGQGNVPAVGIPVGQQPEGVGGGGGCRFGRQPVMQGGQLGRRGLILAHEQKGERAVAVPVSD